MRGCGSDTLVVWWDVSRRRKGWDDGTVKVTFEWIESEELR